ncbi:DinB family protein [Flagellimonas nanhaiensis]|uniref:DinB family protein n=1 Tax=Flagellimonas nanhaiensis TaxID=2292706 RepID=A0A371JM72_9FLAO|nr:DinB family protein [Allomuricauda nanhaiensis]RDY58159.1 DinB family protein [Allomuricauda nanhaiensis]
MLLESVIAELKRNRKIFQETLSGIPLELVYWKNNPKDWSLLEIICHLVDEEVEDFRARVEHTLIRPNEPLKPFDQIAWIVERNYNGQDFDTMLKRFDDERRESITWLRTTKDMNWDNTIEHPQLGSISARSFLWNWLAHDYHHIRQINKIKYAFLKQSSGDSLSYAGKW